MRSPRVSATVAAVSSAGVSVRCAIAAAHATTTGAAASCARETRVQHLEPRGDVIRVGRKTLVREGVALGEQQHALACVIAQPRPQLVDERLGVLRFRRDHEDRPAGASARAPASTAAFAPSLTPSTSAPRPEQAAAHVVERDRVVEHGE